MPRSHRMTSKPRESGMEPKTAKCQDHCRAPPPLNARTHVGTAATTLSLWPHSLSPWKELSASLIQVERPGLISLHPRPCPGCQVQRKALLAFWRGRWALLPILWGKTRPRRRFRWWWPKGRAQFTAPSFIIAQRWEQPGCPSTDKGMNQVWSACAVEYYSTMRKNGVLIQASVWMKLENIMKDARPKGPLLLKHSCDTSGTGKSLKSEDRWVFAQGWEELGD